MAKRIKADNDTWEATLEAADSGETRTLVFFCTSNGQRPYRVVRLDADEPGADGDLEGLSSDALRELFERSESMNVSPS